MKKWRGPTAVAARAVAGVMLVDSSVTPVIRDVEALKIHSYGGWARKSSVAVG